MKNVTVTMEEEVARWARVRAAQNDTSVSRLLGDMLKRFMHEQDDYDRAKTEFMASKPVKLRTKGGYPSRASVHER